MTAPLIGITATKRTLDLPFATVDAHTAFAAYVDRVAAAGGVPVIVPVGVEAPIDALVLTGGADLGVEPERDRAELALVRSAMASGIPVLGVCRGLQVLNVAGGGTLTTHVDGHLDVLHAVEVVAGTTLGSILGPTATVRSLHHQAVDRIGAGLRVGAVAPDGTVEAIEADGGAPVVGVQWHPEIEADDALWRWLVEAAA